MHASYSTESLKLNIVKQMNVDLSINKLYGVIPRKIYHIKGPNTMFEKYQPSLMRLTKNTHLFQCIRFNPHD